MPDDAMHFSLVITLYTNAVTILPSRDAILSNAVAYLHWLVTVLPCESVLLPPEATLRSVLKPIDAELSQQ